MSNTVSNIEQSNISEEQLDNSKKISNNSEEKPILKPITKTKRFENMFLGIESTYISITR